MSYTTLDVCTGGGGEALGLEWASFSSVGAIELDATACQTLRLNRPQWNVLEKDVRDVNGTDFRGVDLIAAGVPCPPFSIAGKQLGAEDERDLFPELLRLIEQAQPNAVMLENVRGLATAKFDVYRSSLIETLRTLGYEADWRILSASSYGVPQLRPRFVLIAMKPRSFAAFRWPEPQGHIGTVGEAIADLVASGGWSGAVAWRERANSIAPTLVSGSHKHGGPDLGPTRAKKQWQALGVDGHGLANEPPQADFPPEGLPRLTIRMAARLQGFPDAWQFAGRKTAAYRQVGNAFPPPVACAVGQAIRTALDMEKAQQVAEILRSVPLTLVYG